MRSHYKRAMDALALSPEARGRIQDKLSHPRRRVRFRPAAVAAAVVLVLALGAPAAQPSMSCLPSSYRACSRSVSATRTKVSP